VGDPQAYRWGDYSSITADPTNPNVFWTAQEYASGRNTWATQITELVVAGTAVVPEPSSIVLSTLGLAVTTCFGLRRRKAVVA
jgi:hypothetical protein